MAATLTRPGTIGRAAVRWWNTWRQIAHLGALVLALMLSPSTYGRAWRPAIALHVVRASAPLVLWFGVVSALLSVVIIRIVLVTAESYGLSQYALGLVVRVLVLELIPLVTALFVALRVTIPAAVELAAMRRAGTLDDVRGSGGDPLRGEIVPRALAGVFSVLLLAALSCVLCLALAYVLAYGFSPYAFERYTRLVGQVFTPAVSLIFSLKTLALSLAVALIPLGSGLHDRHDTPGQASLELQGLVRMFMAILLIEVTSLVGNYY